MDRHEYEYTIATYDRSAEELAEYYVTVGPRADAIERTFDLARVGAAARVREVGCGDGRDAAGIVARLDPEQGGQYIGYDPSAGALALARRRRLPGATFVQGDAQTSNYEGPVDIVFAFASLLHVSREDMGPACTRIHSALHPGGIFYATLKVRGQYEAEMQTDQFGRRMFYYYTAALVRQLAGEGFEAEPAYEGYDIQGSTKWLLLALRKI